MAEDNRNPYDMSQWNIQPAQELESSGVVREGGLDFLKSEEFDIGTPLSYLANLVSGTLRLGDSIGDLLEAGVEIQAGSYAGGIPQGYANYIAKRLVARGKGMTAAEFDEKNPYNVVELEGLAKIIDKATIKYKDEKTGQYLDHIELMERGKIAAGVDQFVNDFIGAAPSMVVSRLPGGYALLGGSSVIEKLNTDLIQRKDQAAENVVFNALVYGGSDAVGEYFGGRFLNKLGGAVGLGKLTPSAYKEYAIKSVGNIIKTAFKGGSGEALQESLTAFVQTLGDDFIYGDEVTKAQYFRKMLHAGSIGFALGSGSGGFSSRLKGSEKQRKQMAEYFAPGSYKAQQVKLSEKQEDHRANMKKAPKEKKQYFQKQIDDIQKKKKELQDQMLEQFIGFSNTETEHFLDLEQIKHDALDIINGGDTYSDAAKEKAKKDFMNAVKNQEELFAVTDINYNKDVEFELSQFVRTAREIDEVNDNLWFKDKKLDYNYVDTAEEFEKLKKEFGNKVGASADGFFEVTEDGKKRIFINRLVAASNSATNVIGHELLHYAISNRFANDPELLRSSVVAFNKYLDQVDPNIRKSIEKRLANPKNEYAQFDENGQVKRDEDGLILMKEERYIEEYFTMFSDLIKNKRIKAVEEASVGIKNNFRTMVRGLGLGFDKADFQNGQEVFDLLIDYNKNLGRKGLLGRITQRKAIESIAGKKSQKVKAGKTASRSALVDDINKMQQGAETKEDFQKPQIFNKVFKALEPGGAINNYIRSLGMSREKTEETIDSVTDRLINFDPAAKRKDGSVIGSKGLGEFIMANVGFAKLDAAKTLAKRSEKTKTETSIDTREAREIEDDTVTPKETKREPKKIVLAERFKITEKVNDAIKKVLPKFDIKNLTFKNLKNKLPNITGELFGIAPKKIKNLANLTKKELQAAQMFINKNADLLIAMLPEGSTISGTSTGVPNTLLKAFYTKTDRAKAAKTGSKAGLAIQIKNPNITKKQFLEVFGIIDGKPTRDDRNTSARVLALANLTGKMLTNQAVRQNIQNLTDNTQEIQNIKEGSSDLMFSMNKTKSFLSKYPGFSEVFFNINTSLDNYDIFLDKMLLLANYGKPGLIREVDLRNFGITNPAVKEYARSSNLNEELGFVFTKGSQEDRTYLRPDAALGKSAKEITPEKIKKYNESGQRNFDDMIDMIEKAVKDNPNDKQLIQAIYMYLSSAVNDTSHPLRTGAEYVGGIDVDYLGELLYEHALQNANVRDVIMDAIITGKDLKETVKAVKQNYKLIAMSVADAAAVDSTTYINENGKAVKFKNGMGLIDGKPWDLFKDSWLDRYFNAIVNAVDPSKYKVAKSGKTFANEYKVAKSGRISYSKSINNTNNFSKAILYSRSTKNPTKGITILDFDDTLATTNSLVRYTAPNGTTGTLNAEQYASTYQDLQEQGYVFDFSEFNKVVDGKIAPLFNKALKLQSKFGSKSMFVLTARPPESAKAIYDFLRANGLNIPLENITGLANSTSEAKALWIAGKVGEGFNDFYFADDALQNVQAVDNMLEQFDVKRKVQQARINFSNSLDSDFNKILEEVVGIKSEKRFDFIKARKRGASKGKFRFFIPPSHEDFVGLLYNFMGKGRKGDAHRDFFERALIRPLLRAHREIDTAKQAVANDYKALNEQMPEVRKMLTKKTPDGDFTYQDAIRVYIWDKHGYDIPGLSKVNQKDLVNLVKKDPDLQAYAEAINIISKQDTYVDPGPNWETGNMRIDLVDATGRVGRKTYFAEFQENADIIFSEENLNKIEAAYGKNLREALEDMLYRIKTGINRPKGSSAKPNMLMNWLNASVSGVMFFNTRSSILQQMSNVNYLNFADNNIFAAAKAFANQPQYWKDFAMIFNSDMLKQRRGGLQTDINGAELAEAIKKARPGNLFDQVAIIIGKALKLGFLPTQIGDNIAIATGGATFYRNRVNKYIKDGLSQKEAETKAFNDFQEITQSTQQSAKPYMTSAQQAAAIGKLVLNFLNTPSQYNRIIKKAGSDIKNRRITPPNTTQMQSDMSNMSRILYYGAAQNLIFYSLQTALFAVMFGGEDEDEDERTLQLLKKKERVINGTIDTILRGSGIYGVAVSTLKNMAIKFLEQRQKGYNKDESAVIMELLNFSPVVGIKARRIVNAEKTLNYNMKVIKEMETFDIDNPVWSAVTNYTQTITTAPTNKIYQKVINLRNAADSDYTLLQRILFFSGYTTWSLNLGDTKKMKEIKEKVKSKNKKSRSTGKRNPNLKVNI
tara:strand:+ start:2126 stop:8875 length:6750 start_codon:yes stop_codon:yes gene_type:complete